MELAERHLRQLDGWTLIDGDRLGKGFGSDFRWALRFVNRVAEVEGSLPRRPDPRVEPGQADAAAHAVNGLREDDFIFAAKIDRISSAAAFLHGDPQPVYHDLRPLGSRSNPQSRLDHADTLDTDI